MQSKNIGKISAVCLAGTLLFSLQVKQVSASPYISDQPVAGITKVIHEYYSNMSLDTEVELSIEYEDLGIANVETYLNIRKGPGEDKEKIGRLPKDGGCEILEVEENGWAKIKSGKITGYVLMSYLITGEEAANKVKDVASLVATVTDATTLRVRESDSLLSDTIALIPEGEELEVVETLPEWIKVKIDQSEGYVASQYITLSYELKKAVPIEKEKTSQAGQSSLRSQLVSYAKQFLGGRYVWGGTNLKTGVDCSGFTQAIYRKFGYSLPRVSRSQASSGKSIKSSQAKAGDLFFYGSGSYIDHVAIYIGNGQVIHASNPRSGIKISNAFYKTPVKVVRYINE